MAFINEIRREGLLNDPVEWRGQNQKVRAQNES